VRVDEIISELTLSRFTGFSTLSSPSLHGTLVFKSGVCVLAKVQNLYGNAAWDTVAASMDLVTDIALSELDTAQLQLALDFNKKAGVHPAKSHGHNLAAPAAAGDAGPSPEHGAHAAHSRIKQKEREFIKTTPAVSPIIHSPAEKSGTKQTPSPLPAQDGSAGDTPPGTDQTPAEQDLETFDSMDLDDVAQKIRKDCKIILKQLQLDHLTEE